VILLYCPVFQTILFYLIFHFPLMGSSIGTEWSLFLSILFLRKQYTFIEIFDDAIRGLDKNPDGFLIYAETLEKEKMQKSQKDFALSAVSKEHFTFLTLSSICQQQSVICISAEIWIQQFYFGYSFILSASHQS